LRAGDTINRLANTDHCSVNFLQFLATVILTVGTVFQPAVNGAFANFTHCTVAGFRPLVATAMTINGLGLDLYLELGKNFIRILLTDIVTIQLGCLINITARTIKTTVGNMRIELI
jgi:hypothetical protein